jgi:CheY-like chemotaxis protein
MLRTAASGHDALDLLAAGVQADAILVDLAMPGIDGWETIRRIRRLGPSGAPIAIVSANAFDKGLDNDVGIRPEDFLVKPVRHAELLAPLLQAVQLGYYRGILNQLDAIEAAQPACAGFAQAMRDLARQFRFEAIARELARTDAGTEGALR